MDARPRGPAAKREPSPEGLGLNPEGDLSAVGAALTLGPLALVSLGADSGFPTRCTNQRPRMRLSLRKAARGLTTPLSLTGNPEGAEGPAVQLSVGTTKALYQGTALAGLL
jgi:hypothetical protein